MPKINDLDLPFVTLSAHDPAKVAAALDKMELPVEALLEVAIYIKREMEKAATLSVIADVARARIKAIYEALPEADRQTTRVKVGMITFSAAGEKVEIRDRDEAIAALTDEQIRISYKPDVKALETILKKDAFERLIKRTPTNGVMAIKDIPASSEYDELDY